MDMALNILITGSAGFIGRALTEKLLQSSGHTIYGIDRTPLKIDHERYKAVQVDVTKPGWTEHLNFPVDIVIHLAQSSRYREFPQGAPDMFRVTVQATFELLEWSRRKNIKKWLYSSTGNVYRPSSKLLNEEDHCDPVTMYAATKLCAEHLALQYRPFFLVHILRLFGVYGPGQTGMTIPNMIERVRTGEEIVLAQGMGLYFTPLYITDCVRMFEKLLFFENHLLCNLSGSERVHLGQVVNIAEASLKKRANVRLTEDPPVYLLETIERFVVPSTLIQGFF
jgi:UDP-glucose 4-epimerase